MNDLKEEIYKIIEDYPEYSISNLGNVKTNKTGRILTPHPNTSGYLSITLSKENKKHITIHRLIAKAFIFNDDNSCNEIDHIDQDILNNDISNLRWCNHSQNQTNKPKYKNMTSKYKGVSWYKSRDKWVASIRINKQLKHLGYFKNEKDAGKAYNKYVLEHNLQEFYFLNTI